MSFLETPRFPESIAFGFTGGPMYLTSFGVLPSGYSKRNIERQHGLGRWVATKRGKTQAETNTLMAFRRAVKGRAHGFRFKDYIDFEASASEGVVTLISGSNYQMYKRYTAGALTEDRIIQKPVESTITISGTGTYTLNSTLGIVTVVSGSPPTGWSGEFDVPCVFADDEVRAEIIDRDADGFLFSWGDLTIEETRDIE